MIPLDVARVILGFLILAPILLTVAYLVQLALLRPSPRAAYAAAQRARAIQVEDTIGHAAQVAEDEFAELPTDEIPAVGLNLRATGKRPDIFDPFWPELYLTPPPGSDQ